MLSVDELEKFGIDLGMVQDMRDKGQFYSRIHSKRSAMFARSYPETIRYVGEIKECHQEAIGLLRCECVCV